MTCWVAYTYDSWGNILTTTGSLAATLGQDNPFRYRGYYFDTETGLYYLNSRYYDPETGRFINSDSVLDNRGVNTINLFAYGCNNPVSNVDPSGHFAGTIIGAIVGGVIGGAAGAISAICTGKSVKAGFVTGAVTGAIIGGVCGAVADAVSTGGLSVLAGAAITAGVCGVVATGGNAANQYWNYNIEKKSQSKAKTSGGKSKNSDSKTPRSSNGKLASECDSFADYVDYKSIAVSGITAMIFAPLGMGANCVVNSAFIGVEPGASNIAGQVIANFAMGGNLSILQCIIEWL